MGARLTRGDTRSAATPAPRRLPPGRALAVRRRGGASRGENRNGSPPSGGLLVVPTRIMLPRLSSRGAQRGLHRRATTRRPRHGPSCRARTAGWAARALPRRETRREEAVPSARPKAQGTGEVSRPRLRRAAEQRPGHPAAGLGGACRRPRPRARRPQSRARASSTRTPASASRFPSPTAAPPSPSPSSGTRTARRRRSAASPCSRLSRTSSRCTDREACRAA